MKKGFTLIELLGVIVVLGLIITVAIPSLIESNKTAQINEVEDFNNTIELAAKDYVNSCSSLEYCLNEHSDAFEALFEVDTSVTFPAKELVESGFLKENFTNPATNKKVSEEGKNITVTSSSGKLTAEYN